MSDDDHIQDPMTVRLQSELDRLLDQLATEEGGLPHDDRYEVDCRVIDGIHRLQVRGLVLQSPPDEFVARFRAALADHLDQPVLLDLSGCRYLCKEALKALVSHVSEIARTSTVLTVRPPEKMLRLIELTGLADLVILVEDQAMAMQLFRNRGLIP